MSTCRHVDMSTCGNLYINNQTYRYSKHHVWRLRPRPLSLLLLTVFSKVLPIWANTCAAIHLQTLLATWIQCMIHLLDTGIQCVISIASLFPQLLPLLHLPHLCLQSPLHLLPMLHLSPLTETHQSLSTIPLILIGLLDTL